MKQFKTNNYLYSDKIHLDKYYTPIEIARYCVEKTKENITHWIHIKDRKKYNIIKT